MPFVHTKNGHEVSLSEVIRFQRLNDRVEIDTRDGTSYQVFPHIWEQAMSLDIVNVLPAAPGSYLLTPMDGDDGREILDQDVLIGWALRSDGYLTPIAAEGIDEMDRAVLHPNGQVTRGLAGDWRTLDDYVLSRSAKPA